MERTVFTPAQLHLLEMFSYVKNDEELKEIKRALSKYFAEQAEDEMEKLWESGEWNQEKNEAILKEHLRTPYGKR